MGDSKEGGQHAELAPHDNGQAKWKMEFNTPGGVAPGIGIPQSQIMDTGTYVRAAPNMGGHDRPCRTGSILSQLTFADI